MSLRLRLCAAFLIAFLAISTHVSSVIAVTYGDPVENPAAKFPEVVPVWLSDGMCSGTLIEQQVVLTAAHCVYGEDGPIQISVGGSNLLNGNRIDVDATWYHPRYDEVFAENDIGLLHLVKPAGVARLGTLPKSMAVKPSTFTLLGWGRDQNDRLTGNLSKLKLTNYETYTKKTYKSSYNTNTMIGAGRYFSSERLYGGSCSGDSGGPLYNGTKSREIVGVTSWGSAKGCTSYRPSVFVRVSFHVKTILSGIKKLKLRAIQSGSDSSTTAPATTAPATTTPRPLNTTTTTTPAPLVITYLTYSQNQNWSTPGLNGTFRASADIAKWCVALDGQALPDYRYVTGKGFRIEGKDTPTQSGGAGCFENIGYSWSDKKLADIVGPSGLDSGRHSIVVTAYDALGRSGISPTIYFNGGKANDRYAGDQPFWANVFDNRSRTGEIEIRLSVTNSMTYWSYDSFTAKVCHVITRDGLEVTNMRSGFWALSDPNCVTNPSTTNTRLEYSSGVVDDPAGTQHWSVYATAYNSKGAIITTDAYWFDS